MKADNAFSRFELTAEKESKVELKLKFENLEGSHIAMNSSGSSSIAVNGSRCDSYTISATNFSVFLDNNEYPASHWLIAEVQNVGEYDWKLK